MARFEKSVSKYRNGITLNVIHLHPSTQTFSWANTIIIQQDGAPPDFWQNIMDALSATYPGRRIGGSGYALRPHNRPGLVPPDFFPWSCVKNYVYVGKIGDLVHLKARIWEAAEQVTRDTLQRVWQEVQYRLDIHRASNGARVKISYLRLKLFKVHFKLEYSFLECIFIFLNIDPRNPEIVFGHCVYLRNEDPVYKDTKTKITQPET
jgi:hypothetical protein